MADEFGLSSYQDPSVSQGQDFASTLAINPEQKTTANDFGFAPDKPDDDFGFKPKELEKPKATENKPDEDFGFIPAEPKKSHMVEYVKTNVAKVKAEEASKEKAGPRVADDFIDEFKAGFDMSATGLAISAPEVVLAENPGRVAKVMSMIGQISGDLPFMALGAAGFGLAASRLGPKAEVAAAEFGAGYVPETFRRMMMDHYQKGDIVSFDDFWDRFSAASWEGIKMGTTNVATMGAGRFAAGKVAGKFYSGMAKTTAEVATMVGIGSAMEGKMPDAEDFLNTGIVLFGLGGATKFAGKARGMFADHGASPFEIADQAGHDTVLKQQLAAENPPVPLRIESEMDLAKSLLQQQLTGEDTLAAGGKLPTLAGKAKEIIRKPLETAQRANDRLADVKFIQERLVPLDEMLPADKDAYIALRSKKAASATVAHFEEFGTVDFKTGKVNGEPLAKIYEDIPKKFEEDITPADNKILDQVSKEDKVGMGPQEAKFTSYLLARRAIEKSAQGIETGFDLEAAKEVVANGKEYASVAKRYTDYYHKVLKYYADSGFKSKEELNDILSKNKDYVKYARELLPDAFSGETESSGGALRHMEGSKLKVKSPLIEGRRDLVKLIADAHDNNGKSLLIEKQEAATARGGEQLIKKVENKGALKSNEIIVYRDGEAERWAFHEDYADAAKGINYHPGKMNLLQKLAKVPAGMLRAGSTTLSLGFQFANFFKDQITAGIMSKSGQVPFLDVFDSMSHVFGRTSDKWQKYLLSGGFSHGLDEINKASPFSLTDPLRLDRDYGIMDTAWNVIKTPLEALEYVSSSVEQIPRFTEAKRSGGLEPGATQAQLKKSGWDARNVTVDFDKSGMFMATWGKYVPFLNAALQGTENELKNLIQNPKRAHTMAIASITLPSLYTWYMNKDDSRYKNANLWEKNAYWLFPMDKWEKAFSQDDYDSRPDDLRKIDKDGNLLVNNGPVFRLKKPYFLGTMYGSLLERSLDKFYGSDPDAFKDFGTTIFKSLFPDNVAALAPTALAPVQQISSNYIEFSNRPIVNNYMEKFLPEERVVPQTTETAKAIAKLIGSLPGYDEAGKGATLNSPVTIETLVQDWAGDFGMNVLALTDTMLSAKARGQPDLPATDWSDKAILKSFFARSYKRNAEVIQDFYQRAAVSEMANNSLTQAKAALESAKTPEQIQYAQQRVDEITEKYKGKVADIKDEQQALSAANKAINNLYKSNEYTGVQKRQMMESLYWRMIKIAQSGVDKFREREKLYKLGEL